MNRQRIHIGAKPDDRPIAIDESPDDASRRKSAMDIETPLIKPIRYQIGRLMLLIGKLGVSVNSMAPGDDVRLFGRDLWDDIHTGSSL
jgi:hypothetical protein